MDDEIFWQAQFAFRLRQAGSSRVLLIRWTFPPIFLCDFPALRFHLNRGLVQQIEHDLPRQMNRLPEDDFRFRVEKTWYCNQMNL